MTNDEVLTYRLDSKRHGPLHRLLRDPAPLPTRAAHTTPGLIPFRVRLPAYFEALTIPFHHSRFYAGPLTLKNQPVALSHLDLHH